MFSSSSRQVPGRSELLSTGLSPQPFPSGRNGTQTCPLWGTHQCSVGEGKQLEEACQRALAWGVGLSAVGGHCWPSASCPDTSRDSRGADITPFQALVATVAGSCQGQDTTRGKIALRNSEMRD